MGLDMYLYLEKYESEYEVKYEEREKLRNKIMERLYPDEMLPLMKSMDEKRKITLSRIARYNLDSLDLIPLKIEARISGS